MVAIRHDDSTSIMVKLMGDDLLLDLIFRMFIFLMLDVEIESREL